MSAAHLLTGPGTPSITVTTRFGTFEVDPASMIEFPDGLPGFEACRRFVMLSSPDLEPLHGLHCVHGPDASFLTVNPRLVLPRYRCIASEGDRLRLGVSPTTTLLWMAIVTVAEDDEITVNLRAPVVINPERMVGYQLMPHQSLYPLRHRVTLDALARTGTE